MPCALAVSLHSPHASPRLWLAHKLFSAGSRSSTDDTKDQVEGDDTTIVEPEQGNGADILFFLLNPLLTSLQSSLTSFPSCGPAQTSPVSPCRPSSSKNDPCWRELQSWSSTAHIYTASLTMPCSFMAHPDTLLPMPAIDDPVERFVSVVKFYLSGWHIRPP